MRDPFGARRRMKTGTLLSAGQIARGEHKQSSSGDARRAHAGRAGIRTCEGDRSCGCTVPSFHPSPPAYSQQPAHHHLHPSHSYWPLLRCTADPLGTGRQMSGPECNHLNLKYCVCNVSKRLFCIAVLCNGSCTDSWIWAVLIVNVTEVPERSFPLVSSAFFP